MQLDDDRAELLKAWIIKELESASDADSDVLADYVLALVRTDEPEDVAKANAIENLKDFLGDNATKFVQDVLTAIKTQIYDPSRPKPALPGVHRGQQLQHGSRKRPYQRLDEGLAQAPPVKHARTGARSGYEGGPPRTGRPTQFPNNAFAFPPVNPSTIDYSSPLASIMAMHQALGLPLPDLNGTPGMVGVGQFSDRQRCRNYDMRGFCAVGDFCPYEHGDEPLPVTPSQHGRLTSKLNKTHGANSSRRNRNHAEFSQWEYSRDDLNAAVIVKQIPEEYCRESSVRDFFASFGAIDKLELDPQRRLAIVAYADVESARTAYQSPKAIFGNRFVKVFWYKPQAAEGSYKVDVQEDGPELLDVPAEDGVTELDSEEFMSRLEEAQRKYDEMKILREKTEKQKSELNAKLLAIEDERRRLKAILASKRSGTESDEDVKEANERANALKAQLAELEAEAVSLGIDPNAPADHCEARFSYYPGRVYRGSRARWQDSTTTWQHGRGRAVMNLDNRPKAVTVRFSDGSFQSHEKALQRYLVLHGSESTILAQHPIYPGAALLKFHERWQAEDFIDAANANRIEQVGKLDLAWYRKSDEEQGSKSESTTMSTIQDQDKLSETGGRLVRDLDTWEEGEDGEVR